MTGFINRGQSRRLRLSRLVECPRGVSRELGSAPCPVLFLGLLLLLGLPACGGGGGGGGKKSPTGGSADLVSFTGFSFQLGDLEVSAPPLEDLSAVPSTLGGPLNLKVIFHFSGVPEGPFGQASLPIFTTPADITAAAGANPAVAAIAAKGDYVLVGNTVEFTPFVPTSPIMLSLSAPATSVPGLQPDSLYRARVVTSEATKIVNLNSVLGPVSGEVQFGTTSNPAAYYPKGLAGVEPPRVTQTDPADEALDFYPGTFSASSLESGLPLFPPGPKEILLTYDKGLLPTADNLFGKDLDGDGVVDAQFFLRARGTRLLVAHEVPQDSFGGHPSFAAVSGVDETLGVDMDGGDVFLHADGSGALDGPDAGLLQTPSSMATDQGGSLLWMSFHVEDGGDLLTVADHVQGDPSHALMAVDGTSGGAAVETPRSIDLGLQDVVGLTSLLDGRLVAYDRGTRRIHELLPTVVRRRPAVGSPTVQEPVLLGVLVGDGTQGFRSEPQPDSAGEIIDLAVSPSGELFALSLLDGDPSSPSILRLASIDFDGDGVFAPDDGLFSGLAEDVLLNLVHEYVDLLGLVAKGQFLGLNRTLDTIDVLDLEGGRTGTLVDSLAAFGHPLGGLEGGLSPAVALTAGFIDYEADVELLSNVDDEAVVQLKPGGLLPIGSDLFVMQRHALTSLFGVSEVNADPAAPLPPMGSRVVLSLRTADALVAPIQDTFKDSFIDRVFEDSTPVSTHAPAEWSGPFQGSANAAGLRASVGASVESELGDFVPLADSDFKPESAYKNGIIQNAGESDLDTTGGNFTIILLDTDAQSFPLPSGSTPGLTQQVLVQGGRFAFRDVIIPEGVLVVAKGSRPLVITATRTLEIHGMIDVKGTSGLSDDSFDSGFLPVRGGPQGPAAGRGGDAHPTLYDPAGPGTIDQYVTPETGEDGFGPVVNSIGAVSIQQVGGRGGLSSMGYTPADGFLFPTLNNLGNNTEHSRPPGGGGGSFRTLGDAAHGGSGVYLVQSNSSWFPFDKCPNDNAIFDVMYGNDENLFANRLPNTSLQCVYQTYKPGFMADLSQLERLKPGGVRGDAVFVDADPDNDFLGSFGEVPVLIGGQGGGGGGSRIDSVRQGLWSLNVFGAPVLPPVAPPFYPKLFISNVFLSPTLYDAKGGGGGGGGGVVQLISLSDIVIGRTGHIDASGGHGGGGEIVGNSTYSGGGGGGSGGAIVLQAAVKIRVLADADHMSASFTDLGGAEGASLDVSGGMGRDVRTSPAQNTSFSSFTREFTRSDGGSGGAGLIQLQQGDGTGKPLVEQGAFLFTKRRTVRKLGGWSGDPGKQKEHPSFTPGAGLPKELRYIDMLHYRIYGQSTFYVLNGSYPPIMASVDGANGNTLVNEFPVGSAQTWFDTKMMENPEIPGSFVVQEPEPESIIDEYNGFGPNLKDINFPASHPEFPDTPGSTFAGKAIPMGMLAMEPSGELPKVELDGKLIFDPANLIRRLPVVHPDLTSPSFGVVSRGTSRWLDYNGVALRMRDAEGRPPPFFESFHGTFHGSQTKPVPTGKDGQVILDAKVAGKPARYVFGAGLGPELGLYGDPLSDPPFNDIKVDAPDASVLLSNAVTDNATVTMSFQGAYPVRSGSSVPDEETITAWVPDLTELAGFPLIRFQVGFDLGADPQTFPLDVTSFRPKVDYVRIRSVY
jgi:hypothetical protein